MINMSIEALQGWNNRMRDKPASKTPKESTMLLTRETLVTNSNNTSECLLHYPSPLFYLRTHMRLVHKSLTYEARTPLGLHVSRCPTPMTLIQHVSDKCTK